MTEPLTDLPHLPEGLKKAKATTKMLYLWLEPQGKVSYSMREMMEELKMATQSMQDAVDKLKEIGLWHEITPRRGRIPATFYVGDK